MEKKSFDGMPVRVFVTDEVKRKLGELFGVTSVMVWKALSYESDSDLARKIRRAAVANGGYDVVTAPVMETFFDSDGVIRQYLGNGARIEINKKTEACDVYMEGHHVMHKDRIRISELEKLQKEVAGLKLKDMAVAIK